MNPEDAQPGPGEITRQLLLWNSGDTKAWTILVDEVYPVLRQIARQVLRGESDGIQVTELVNESMCLLEQRNKIEWRDRQHFFRHVGLIMRRLLVDEARHRLSLKRGGESVRVEWVPSRMASGTKRQWDLLALDEVLGRLAEIDVTAVRIVELRFFAGFTIEETADWLDKSRSSVWRTWQFARAWLRDELSR